MTKRSSSTRRWTADPRTRASSGTTAKYPAITSLRKVWTTTRSTNRFAAEAIVVIANEGEILKAIPNPYMCQDRPVVAFQWDGVPNIFWGRGVYEKGYMSQALDAELEHASTAHSYDHPMMAGNHVSPWSQAGSTSGSYALDQRRSARHHAVQLWSLNAITFQQGAALQRMVSQATGAADGSMPQVQNDVTAAGMSMSQGGIVKRQKRTLVSFKNFLIPFVKKAAFRYMQFNPEEYPIGDYNFIPFSSLGAMARGEYRICPPSYRSFRRVTAHGAIVRGSSTTSTSRTERNSSPLSRQATSQTQPHKRPRNSSSRCRWLLRGSGPAPQRTGRREPVTR